jgi:hypothetical protein
MGIDRPRSGIHSGRRVAPLVELTRRRLLGAGAARGAGMLLASWSNGARWPATSFTGTRTRSPPESSR